MSSLWRRFLGNTVTLRSGRILNFEIHITYLINICISSFQPSPDLNATVLPVTVLLLIQLLILVHEFLNSFDDDVVEGNAVEL